MDLTDQLDDQERAVLQAEADLLERVALLATVPGRVVRHELDLVLRAVELPAVCRGRRRNRVPRPRCRSEA